MTTHFSLLYRARRRLVKSYCYHTSEIWLARTHHHQFKKYASIQMVWKKSLQKMYMLKVQYCRLLLLPTMKFILDSLHTYNIYVIKRKCMELPKNQLRPLWKCVQVLLNEMDKDHTCTVTTEHNITHTRCHHCTLGLHMYTPYTHEQIYTQLSQTHKLATKITLYVPSNNHINKNWKQ